MNATNPSPSPAEEKSSEARHTPGPWRLETESRDAQRGSDLLVTDAEGGYSIADCDTAFPGSGGMHPDEYARAQANARLIAAAPDLLEALRSLVTHIDRMNAKGIATATGDAQLAECRAAIAKATEGSR